MEFVQLGGCDDNVRGDAAATGYLAAAVRKLHFRGMLGNFPLVVIFVEGDGFVIALNQAATGSVVTRGSQRETGVFAERGHRLNQALAEGGFADNQTAVVILHRAGNDLRSRSRIIIHQDDERHSVTAIAAHCGSTAD